MFEVLQSTYCLPQSRRRPACSLLENNGGIKSKAEKHKDIQIHKREQIFLKKNLTFKAFADLTQFGFSTFLSHSIFLGEADKTQHQGFET